MRAAIIVAALMFVGCATPPQAAPKAGERIVVVRLTNVREAVGHVNVALWSSSDTYLKSEKWAAAQGAVAIVPETTVTFEHVALGRYAISAFHDRTDAGKLRRGPLGIPADPWGFSAPSLFGPPTFEHAAIDVDAGDEPLVVEISLIGGST